jgi:cell division initiation protein
MKITPLEIRQKTFEKVLRGYDKDEVSAYLLSLSQEWERILDEMRELKYKLDASDKENVKLREMETSLFRTLKTAEDTGATMIEQANKTAELHLRETQFKAEAMLSDAKSRAKALIEDAEAKSWEIIKDMEDEVKELEHTYRILEIHRDNLVSELRNMANDTINKVERISTGKKKLDIDINIQKSKGEVKETNLHQKPSSLYKEKAHEDVPSSEEFNTQLKQESDKKEKPRKEEGGEESSSGSGSFFDQI